MFVSAHCLDLADALLTCDLISQDKKIPSSRSTKRKVLLSDSDDDSDVEMIESGPSTSSSKSKTLLKSESSQYGKRRKSGILGQYSSPSSSPDGNTKGKGKAQDAGPSEAVIATWAHRDDDLEPSSKMYALLGYLKEWDTTGDKVICYSQCMSWIALLISCAVYCTGVDFDMNRDVDVGLDRNSSFSTWDQESSVRW